MIRLTGTLLAAHGTVALTSTPVRDRALRMQHRGFAPGVPHALLVPLLEVVAGKLITGRGPAARAAAVAATALGAVRTGADLQDRSVTPATVAAAGLTAVGVHAVSTRTSGVGRGVLLGLTAAVTVFELARRRHVLRAR
jgi:hypothetical protein